MAITTYIDDLAHPLGLFDRFSGWLGQFSKSVQYSQMMRALAQLDDAQLAQVGVKRADIPSYAHALVYHEG